MRRTLVAITVVVVVVIAVVLVVRGRPPEPSAPAAVAVRTTTVKLGDLTNTRTLQAQLGFGAARPVKGAATGTVTKLPAPGQTTELGEELYRVDDQPVVVFFGATPLFRALDAPGLKGSDVAVLMDNLAALGYSVGTRPKDATKAEFTQRVIDAVKKWQKALGVEQTGTLAPGRVLVLDRPMRVGAVKAQPGAPAAEELFELTPTARLVTLQIPVTEAGALKAGTAVVVVRPDNRSVPAKITSVTPVAAPPENGSGPKADVVVTPDNPADVEDLDTAPVRVTVVSESRTGVLVVPLAALVALKEGGYALQLRSGELKAVRTGLYSQDEVEVSGDGVAAGLEVVTAS